MTEAASHRCSLKKVFLNISQYSQENTSVESLLNKVASQKPCNFIEMRLQHRGFPVNIQHV